MLCDGCGNQHATRIRANSMGMICNRCGDIRGINIPDVFFPGPYIDPHLVDTSKPNQVKNGVFISSRREKAEIMRKLGVREVGDGHHGRNIDKISIRHERESGKIPQGF